MKGLGMSGVRFTFFSLNNTRLYVILKYTPCTCSIGPRRAPPHMTPSNGLSMVGGIQPGSMICIAVSSMSQSSQVSLVPLFRWVSASVTKVELSNGPDIFRLAYMDVL